MTVTLRAAWMPTTILLVGCLLNGSTRMQRTMDLLEPLAKIGRASCRERV